MKSVKIPLEILEQAKKPSLKSRFNAAMIRFMEKRNYVPFNGDSEMKSHSESDCETAAVELKCAIATPAQCNKCEYWGNCSEHF